MSEFEGQELETSSDVSSETSSESPSSDSQSNEGEVNTKSSETKNEDITPFHQHPRWIERDNELKEERAARKALEERYSQMEKRMQEFSTQKPAQAPEKDELLEDLKKVDPRLAQEFERNRKLATDFQEWQKKLQSFEEMQTKSQQEATRAQAVTQINTWHEENKVSPEMKNFINSQLDLMVLQGNLKTLDQLPNAYKSVHENFKKYEEAVRRTERESYVAAKKVDAKTPTSQPKGKPVTHAPKKDQFSKDKEVARSQIVARYLQQKQAGGDI